MIRTIGECRNFSSSPIIQTAVKNVVVIGGGLMGSGIAQVAAQTGRTGHDVTLVDIKDEILNKSENNIKKSLQRVSKKKFPGDDQAGQKFITDTLMHLKTTTDPNKAVKTADLVIEAIIENLEIKQNLFESLDKNAPQSTIFASNTSSLSIGEISKTSRRKDRFGGLHFFNPVPVMKLLEVIRIPETSDETFNKLLEFGKNIEKNYSFLQEKERKILGTFLFCYQYDKAATTRHKGECLVCNSIFIITGTKEELTLVLGRGDNTRGPLLYLIPLCPSIAHLTRPLMDIEKGLIGEHKRKE
ncbi:hydroxyacyl-coenzyme A dehydrogenase, mitochondrial-like [Centruroides vittatus]|uniref:hydroxyacyl-coenzyme A dehydrogenase, mitochondrial-like n=1 Tax=Centruroides vittatus TaxID=120091 RepID=UPI0035109AA4